MQGRPGQEPGSQVQKNNNRTGKFGITMAWTVQECALAALRRYAPTAAARCPRTNAHQTGLLRYENVGARIVLPCRALCGGRVVGQGRGSQVYAPWKPKSVAVRGRNWFKDQRLFRKTFFHEGRCRKHFFGPGKYE